MLQMFLKPAVTQFYEYQVSVKRTPFFITSYTVIMFLALFVTSFGIRIALFARVYHPNVLRLYCSALAMWLLLFISKICSFLYDIRGYNVSKTVDKDSSGFILLQIGAFLRYFYYFFGSASPLAVTIERGFATVLLADYEKTPRRSIFIGIFSTNLFLSLTFATSLVFFELPVIGLIAIPLCNVIICFILLNILYRYNLMRIRRLNIYHRDTQYTLSKRYQLRENIRILELLMRLIYAILLFIALLVVGLTMSTHFDAAQTAPIKFVTETFLVSNPLIVIPMTAFFIPEFKRYARAVLFRSVQLARGSVDSSQRHVYHHKPNQSDVYFDQFKKSISASSGDQHHPAFIKRYT